MENPDTGKNANAHLWLLGGSVLLALSGAVEVTGPDRAPEAVDLLLKIATAIGGASILVYLARNALNSHIGLISASLGFMTLALGLGTAPEIFALPMNGVGERFMGLPIALLAPVAGVLYLRGFLVAAGTCAALLALGHLQPVAMLSLVKPALSFYLNPFNGWLSLSTLILPILGALLAGAVLLRPSASTTDSPVPPIQILGSVSAKLLCVFLPAWTFLQMALAQESGQSTGQFLAALLCSAGGITMLYGGLTQTSLNNAHPRWKISVEALTALAICGLWLLLKSFTWRWSTTDENIYFYDAMLLAKGQLPYRDFFFAHPPLHIAVPAALFAIFDFNLMMAKLIPALSALVTGLIVYKICRDKLGGVTAVCALAFHLFAFELLQGSTNLNGVNLTSLWITLGFYWTIHDKPRLAGASLGAAICTGFYAIAAALALLTLGLFRGKRGLKTVEYFVLVGGGINLICWAIAGDAYLESVYRFHWLKAEKNSIPAFIKLLHYHGPLLAGLALAPVMVAWQHWRAFSLFSAPDFHEQPGSFFSPFKLFSEPATGTVKIAWLVTVTLLIELALFNELYDFYFVLIFPTCAICAGYTLSALLAAFRHEFATQNAVALCCVVALLGSWSLHESLTNEAQWIFSARKGKGVNSEFLRAGTKRRYRWIEPAALSSLATPVVGALFWRDHRTRWHSSPPIRHFLWQKSLYVSVMDEVSEYVRSNSEKDETVAGNSLTAPMVALASNRRIAANFVDTNAKRFRTKLTSEKTFFEAICKDKIRYIVASPSGYINNRRLNQLRTARKFFKPVKRFPDRWAKFKRRNPWTITLWEARNRNDIRCRWID